MPLHPPSLAAAAAVIALLLALSVWLASWRPRRDALPATGLGLLACAAAFASAAGVGLMPDWTSEVAAPVGQSVALSAYTWGLLRLHARAAPWQNLTVMPALMGVLMVFLADLPTARDLSHDAVLIVQCLVLLIWSQRLALEHGQMHRLLMLGAGLGLLMNVCCMAGTVLLGITPTSEPLALTRAEAWRLASELVLAFVPACALLLMSREDREMALQRLALRDPLTGIANHPAIADRCESEVEQARRSGSPLGVVLIEIDQLPSLRTRQGQALVDEALQHTAGHLAERIRRSDSVGRYGPHAFLLLLPNTPTPGARHVLRALRESMLDAPAQGSGADVLPLSISMGLWCGVPNPRDSAETLIAQAATALQAAQEAGANRMRVAA
jgi:diguanylate cyclase (GGDEF)-like protein